MILFMIGSASTSCLLRCCGCREQRTARFAPRLFWAFKSWLDFSFPNSPRVGATDNSAAAAAIDFRFRAPSFLRPLCFRRALGG